MRIHFMQHWFRLSDPAIGKAFFDVPLYREFAWATRALKSAQISLQRPTGMWLWRQSSERTLNKGNAADALLEQAKEPRVGIRAKDQGSVSGYQAPV